MDKKEQKIIDIKKHELSEEGREDLKNIEELMGGAFSEAELTAVFQTLLMPDSDFLFVKEILLSELEKTLSNPNEQLIMVQALNLSGKTGEDMIKFIDDLCIEIEMKLKDKFIPAKVEFLQRYLRIIGNSITESESVGKRIVAIPVELLKGATMPRYANINDIGLDVFANIEEDISIKPGETALIPTGIKVSLPKGYEFQVRPRSGMSLKTKLRVANSPGTIDPNYLDEIMVIVENIEPKITDITTEAVFVDDVPVEYKIVGVDYGRDFVITPQQKFAQLVLVAVPTATLYEVENISKFGQDRGGGFGSTDAKDDIDGKDNHRTDR